MGLTSNPIQNCWIAYFSPSISRLDWTQTVYEIPGEQDNWASFCCFYTPAPRRGRGAYCFTSVRLSVLPSIQDIFRRIFLSNCWWQKSDIWSQASYRYTILWVAFLDPSDSYFLFADFVGFYTHWTYMRGYHKWALAHRSSCFCLKILMYFLFQKVLQDKEQELIEQFDSPDKIRQILSAFSNIIAKSKETVE